MYVCMYVDSITVVLVKKRYPPKKNFTSAELSTNMQISQPFCNKVAVPENNSNQQCYARKYVESFILHNGDFSSSIYNNIAVKLELNLLPLC